MTEQSGTAPVTESAVDVADTLESVAATEAPSAANPHGAEPKRRRLRQRTARDIRNSTRTTAGNNRPQTVS